MAVRIDEARQQRLALEVDDPDRPLRLLLDLGAGADGDDLSAAHEHRLGGRLRVVDRDDRAADIERVDALGRRLRRAAHEPARRPRHPGPGEPGGRVLQERAARHGVGEGAGERTARETHGPLLPGVPLIVLKETRQV